MNAHEIGFSAATKECVESGQWDQASALSHAMRIIANVVGFSTAIHCTTQIQLLSSLSVDQAAKFEANRPGSLLPKIETPVAGMAI